MRGFSFHAPNQRHELIDILVIAICAVIPDLLQLLDVRGATVTIDAMGCQKEIAKVITDQGADYVLALKKNHATLYDDVTLFLNDARATDFAEIDHDYHETVDGDHGRIETRRYWITSAIEWLGGAKASRAELQSIGMVESRRERGEEGEIDTRYFLASLPCDGMRFGHAVRQHWGIGFGRARKSRNWDASGCRD